jgi:hypothetical protein
VPRYTLSAMTGKPGRGGRPKRTEKPRPYQLRLPPDEADAFDEYVKRKSEEAAGTPDALSAAAVLRGLVRAAIGLSEPDERKGKVRR